MRTTAIAAFTITGLVCAVGATRASAATACADLTFAVLPETVISVAERVTSGNFAIPGTANTLTVPTICRVAGTVSPAIKFEVWLPEGAAWNGRFQAVGGGGLAGSISYSAMAEAVRSGFASASTDTGHAASDTAWLRDPQRRVDYGYRAIHEMTVRAKALIDAHYGMAPRYSYFNGCSTGGRQGLMEAQRYPSDYDGIVSGAPVNRFTHLHIGQLWTAHATLKTPGAALTREDYALVSERALAQCDALDGVEDGILNDPRNCAFDPNVLQCGSGQQADGCLASPKIRALEMLYAGPVNPRTGAQIYPGLEPGGEGPQPNNPGWSMIANGERPFPIDLAVLDMVYESSDYDWRTFDFDHDVGTVDAKLYGVLNAIDPDLRDFKSSGGKLIAYHGWNDPGVMPQQTVDYFESVVGFAGDATGGDGYRYTDEYMRLFMMPGVGHCRGGTGPDRADFMSALVAWVEDDVAPDRIEASRTSDGKVTMTRPLCPYPQVARYRGRGNTNDAASFVCAAPQ